MIKNKNKEYKFTFFPSCNGILILTTGFQISCKGPCSSFFFILFLTFFFFLPHLRKEIFFSSSKNPEILKYTSAHKHPQLSDILTWPGTFTQITLTLHTKEMNSQYNDDFLPRNMK